jgi:peptide deformylase
MTATAVPTATILKIVQAGHPVLRQKARALTPEEIRSPDVQRLIEAMRETMRDAPGVGLAAPQVGLGLQLVVIEDKPAYVERGDPEEMSARGRKPVPFQVLVNPRLAIVDATPVEFFEGCLSVADMMMVVPRLRAVRVEALDHRGSPISLPAEGWPARILQHEIDHLRGVLCIDRMRSRTFMSTRNHSQWWANAPVTDVVAAVGVTESPDAPLPAGSWTADS